MSGTSYDSSSTEEEEEEEVRRPPPIAPPPPRKLSKPSAAAPKPKPPIPSSSEDEDDDEGEESSGGGDDTDGNPPPPKPAAPTPTPTQPSDSDSTDDDSAFSVPVPPIDSSASKSLKLPPEWSVECEIALLRRMVEMASKSGRLPSVIDLDALHEFIKGSLSIDVTKPQLWNKVCDLKTKYETVAPPGEERVGPYFRNAHNRAFFELSRQIWPLNVGSSENGAGDEHGEDDEPAGHKKMDELGEAIKKKRHSGGALEMKYSDRLLGQAAEYAASEKRPACIEMEAVEMVDPSKAAMIKEKYKKLILSEIKHDLERMELLKETAKLFMDAIKKMD